MNAPPLTVLMAVYNGLPYLDAALDSVLSQSFADFEFLIIDDCSTDATVECISARRDPRIRLLRNEQNLHQTRSLNRGLEAARSEWIIRMDADDISHPGRFQRQFEWMLAHPEAGMLGCDWTCIDPQGRPFDTQERPTSDAALRWTQFFTCPIGGNAIYRRSLIWERLGGYNPAVRIPQDWELCSRAFPHTKVASLAEKLYGLRVHPQQSSAVNRERAAEEARIVLENSVQALLDAEHVAALAPERRENLVRPRPEPAWKLQRLNDLATLFLRRFPAAAQDPEFRRDLAARFTRLALQCRRWPSAGTAIKTLVALQRFTDRGTAGRAARQWLGSLWSASGR